MNYTSVLNLVFLVLAVVLLVRFGRTGGPEMLRMMNGPHAAEHHDVEHQAIHAEA